MTLADERPPRSRRVLVLLPLIIFLALAVLFFIRLFAGDPARLPSALIGRPVPEFSLPALQGLVRDGVAVPGIAATDLKGDKVTVVNVWASWCAPCRAEHPLLSTLAADPRIRLVGINYKDNAENARRFLGALGNPFVAVGVDTSGRSAIDWGVYGVPETFVVSRDGIIRHKHVGPLSEEAVKTTLADAIAKAAK
jgi:cytochrome c biogenesis protein CcmG, thiol:disulfide interchange protein DsbE